MVLNSPQPPLSFSVSSPANLPFSNHSLFFGCIFSWMLQWGRHPAQYYEYEGTRQNWWIQFSGGSLLSLVLQQIQTYDKRPQHNSYDCDPCSKGKGPRFQETFELMPQWCSQKGQWRRLQQEKGFIIPPLLTETCGATFLESHCKPKNEWDNFKKNRVAQLIWRPSGKNSTLVINIADK